MHQHLIEICKALNERARNSIGPYGSFSIIKRGTGRDADYESVSSCELFIRDVSFHHPIAKLLIQTVRAHLKTYQDHGYILLFLCTQLVLRIHQTIPIVTTATTTSNTAAATTGMCSKPYDHGDVVHDAATSTSVITWALDTVIQWIEEFFEESFHLKCKIDYSNVRQLVSLVTTILHSNQLLNLNDEERSHLSVQIVKAFLKGISSLQSQQHGIRGGGCSIHNLVKFTSIVVSEDDYSSTNSVVCSSSIIDGVVLNMTFPREAHILLDHYLKKDNNYKVILYDVCLDLHSFDQVKPEENSHFDRHYGKTIYMGYNTEMPVLPSKELTAMENYKLLVEQYKSLSVRIIASQKTIHPLVKYLLVQNGIVPLERLSLRYISLVRDVTSATVLSKVSLDPIPPEFVGTLKTMKEVIVAGRSCIVIEGCSDTQKQNPISTIVICSQFQHICHELEFMCMKALNMLVAGLSNPWLVPGAGITELHLIHFFREKINNSISPSSIFSSVNYKLAEKLKKQLLVVIDSFEELVYIMSHKDLEQEYSFEKSCFLLKLSEMNQESLSIITEALKPWVVRHSDQLRFQMLTYGWDCRERAIRDIQEFEMVTQPGTKYGDRTAHTTTAATFWNPRSIMDSFAAKKYAFLSALETAVMLLRIDDLIQS